LVRGEPARCLDAIDQVYNYGHELSQFTGDLLEIVRHATFVRLSDGARRHVDLPADELERLVAATEGVPAEALSRLFTALLEVHDQVSRAGRPRIVLEMAVARLATVRPVQPITALVERLEGLEQRLRSGGAPAPVRGLKEGRPAPADAPRPAPGADPSRPRAAGPPAAKPTSRPGEPGPEGRPARPEAQHQTLTTEPAAAPASSSNRPLDDDGPPPWDEADVGYDIDPEFDLASWPTSRADGPPRAPRAAIGSLEPWPTLQAKLAALTGSAAMLATATPVWQGPNLILQFPAGRPLAEARRAVEQEPALRAFRDVWPSAGGLSVAALPGTGSAKDRSEALRREVLEDPTCATIIRTLGARLDGITSLRD
jgi:hypothetical protein